MTSKKYTLEMTEEEVRLLILIGNNVCGGPGNADIFGKLILRLELQQEDDYWKDEPEYIDAVETAYNPLDREWMTYFTDCTPPWVGETAEQEKERMHKILMEKLTDAQKEEYNHLAGKKCPECEDTYITMKYVKPSAMIQYLCEDCGTQWMNTDKRDM